MLHWIVIIFLIEVSHIESTLDVCRQTFGINKYDLNQMSQLTLLGDDEGFRYALTPCGLVPTDQCGQNSQPFENGMSACQERENPPHFESSMGFLNGYGKPPDLEFSENPQGPGTGVVMLMRNAKCNSGERRVTVTFVCDETVSKPKTMTVKEEPTCTFTITVRAAEACPTNGKKSSSGVSGGTIFVIILLVLIALYLLFGVAYNRFMRNETGLAILPNSSFWLLVFGLFITGCKFIWSFIITCGHPSQASSNGKYESV